MAATADQTTNNGSWTDIFNNLIDSATEAYVAHETPAPVVEQPENPAATVSPTGTTPTTASTLESWVITNQKTILYGSIGLLVFALTVKSFK